MVYRRGVSSPTIEDHAVDMIPYSDNTSTNVLILALGTAAVNTLSASLGAPETLFQRKIMERVADCDLFRTEDSCTRVQGNLAISRSGPLVDPISADVPVA